MTTDRASYYDKWHALKSSIEETRANPDTDSLQIHGVSVVGVTDVILRRVLERMTEIEGDGPSLKVELTAIADRLKEIMGLVPYPDDFQSDRADLEGAAFAVQNVADGQRGD